VPGVRPAHCPNDPTNIEAIEQQDHPGFGQAHDYVDGFHYDFHAGCFPQGSPMWKSPTTS
jgi:hypothetical protein